MLNTKITWHFGMKKADIERLNVSNLAVQMYFKHGRIPRKYIYKKRLNPILFITNNMKHIGLEFYTLEYGEYIVILDNKSLTYTYMPKGIKNELHYEFKNNSIVFKYYLYDIHALGVKFEINEKGKLLLISNKYRRKFISNSTVFRRVTYIALIAWALYTILK